MCQFAEMFDFAAWHHMVYGTFHAMAFDYPESLQSNVIAWNVLEAIRCQAAKLNISACSLWLISQVAIIDENWYGYDYHWTVHMGNLHYYVYKIDHNKQM